MKVKFEEKPKEEPIKKKVTVIFEESDGSGSLNSPKATQLETKEEIKDIGSKGKQVSVDMLARKKELDKVK